MLSLCDDYSKSKNEIRVFSSKKSPNTVTVASQKPFAFFKKILSLLKVEKPARPSLEHTHKSSQFSGDFWAADTMDNDLTSPESDDNHSAQQTDKMDSSTRISKLFWSQVDTTHEHEHEHIYDVPVPYSLSSMSPDVRELISELNKLPLQSRQYALNRIMQEVKESQNKKDITSEPPIYANMSVGIGRQENNTILQEIKESQNKKNITSESPIYVDMSTGIGIQKNSSIKPKLRDNEQLMLTLQRRKEIIDNSSNPALLQNMTAMADGHQLSTATVTISNIHHATTTTELTLSVVE